MLRRRHLGRVSFAEANDLQRALLQSRDDYVLLFEHPPTYTRGVRTLEEHFLIPPSELNAVVIDADRGGDVTYHAPGQVVAWAIVTVDDDPAAGKNHVRHLEDAVIDAVRRADSQGLLGGVGRLDGYPGVWADLTGVPKKIAAVGVRTERNAFGARRTLHGVALNVDIDLDGFKAIVPCGIPDKPVASLRSLGVDVTSIEVEELLGEELERHLGGESRVARVDRSVATTSDERPLLRRLRKAGVDPDAGLAIGTRKPEWLRIEAHMGAEYQSLRKLTEDLRLVTVCEEAGCPNIFECWASGTATFMVNGERCTRACGFCLVDTRKPLPLDPTEPERVAEAVVRLKLAHAVITCVARDDLDDGGAGAIAASVRAIRERSPGTDVEVLTSDLKGDIGVTAVDYRRSARRLKPQRRDRGALAASRSPERGLFAFTHRAGAQRPRRSHHEIGTHGRTRRVGRRSGRGPGRYGRGGRADRHHRPVPSTDRTPPARRSLLGAGGVRRFRRTRSPSRSSPRAVLAAHAIELPRA